MSQRIKILAPATISNINCGFDVLGLALDVVCDEVLAEKTDRPGVELKLVGSHARMTPDDPERNTAGVAAGRFLRNMGLDKKVGVRLEIKKHIKPGSGLGSSAASACAAVFAVNEVLGTRVPKRRLLPFAIEAEAAADGSLHADNVAPCLLGGISLVRDAAQNDVHRLYAPTGMYITVVLPNIQILTSEARGILKDYVPLDAMIKQTADLGAFVHALSTSDFDLLGRSMNDHIIEHQRARLIPKFEKVVQAARDQGVLGCGISGAGPSIFSISNNHSVAQQAAESMVREFAKNNIESIFYVSGVNHAGTVRS